jgi:hypothetical protein
VGELISSPDFQIGVAVGAGALLLVYLILLLVADVLRPLAMAAASGASVGIGHLIGMKLRGTPPEFVITAYVMDRTRGGRLSLAAIEAGYMAFKEEASTPGELLRRIDRQLETPQPCGGCGAVHVFHLCAILEFRAVHGPRHQKENSLCQHRRKSAALQSGFTVR